MQADLSISYDVVVIGAGLVGCAMARQFTLEGAKVLCVEKGADILDGASKANSAILHTGFDAPPGSIEQACIADNYHEFLALRAQFKLPLLATGALVLAWNDDEADSLDGIINKARLNGVDDVKKFSARHILSLESNLSSHLKAGVYVPREFVIDPWTTPYVYMLQAVENGACLACNCGVEGGEFDGGHWQLNTRQGLVKATTVINCAGLYGDVMDKKLINTQSFQIKPRKGQFLLYDTSAVKLVKSIILPVPNEITKGIVICQTAFGKLLVGPTAEEQESRDDASVTTEQLKMLRAKGEEMLPGLVNEPIVASYAGIRPATQFKDFVITPYLEQNYISVGGIRSTGLSACLGIAKHVFKLYSDHANKHQAPKTITWPNKQNQLAECELRDWQKENNGGVVCHCERVTEREVKTALNEGLRVHSLDGLKRRTRVTMGRCQGFYCSARLSELCEGYFDEPIAQNIDAENDYG